jgi:hypothetical protein
MDAPFLTSFTLLNIPKKTLNGDIIPDIYTYKEETSRRALRRARAMNQNESISPNGYSELKTWVEQNADHFKGYSIENIKDLALAAGFKRTAVAQWEAQEMFRGVRS